MNHQYETSNEHPTIRQGVDSALNDLQEKASGTLNSCETKIRQSPEKAVLIAAAAGYCLNFMPVGFMVGAPLRLALFLAKPALFALGAVKVCEIVQDRARK